MKFAIHWTDCYHSFVIIMNEWYLSNLFFPFFSPFVSRWIFFFLMFHFSFIHKCQLIPAEGPIIPNELRHYYHSSLQIHTYIFRVFNWMTGRCCNLSGSLGPIFGSFIVKRSFFLTSLSPSLSIRITNYEFRFKFVQVMTLDFISLASFFITIPFRHLLHMLRVLCWDFLISSFLFYRFL